MCTVIPMPLIWNLKLPARQRIAVMSIFGLGIVVNVAGAIRTAYVYESMIATYDATWMGWPILLSAAIEINLGLVCILGTLGLQPQQANIGFLDLCLRTSPETAFGIYSPPSVTNHPPVRLILQSTSFEALVYGTIQTLERGCIAGPDRRGSPRQPSRGVANRRDGDLVGSHEQDDQRPQHVQCDIEPHPGTVSAGQSRFEIGRCGPLPHNTTQQFVGIINPCGQFPEYTNNERILRKESFFCAFFYDQFGFFHYYSYRHSLTFYI